MKRVRCAIYTRKSSEEGLEQGFNSLDAQREACAAYVLSQASEGWQALPDMYDDGGISGGTLERPALQRLLADIHAGKIDIVVVYKVDRLTRALLDFAKLVETFDKANVSFVSVTQSFNTTTSMGRLTLNMLLSFAQFEREVTAERIRDKIAASKAKGMWMGGTPPLGYEPDGRSLAIVAEHADVVRDIFRRYTETGNVRRVAEELQAALVLTPARETATGRSFGGVPFSRGQIYKILSNPIYIGKIPHQGKLHKGQHEAIIDHDTWEQTQLLLTEHTRGERSVRAPQASMLAGLVRDEADEPLVASHACKLAQGKAEGGKVRYRYYVSRNLQHGAKGSNHGVRIPARELEAAVIEQLAAALEDPLDLAVRIGQLPDAHELRVLTASASVLAEKVRQKDHATIRLLVERVQVLPRELTIELSWERLGIALAFPASQPAMANVTFTLPVRLTRTGMAMRLVQSNGKVATRSEPDQPLIKLLLRAREWWARLSEGEIDITRLCAEEGVSDTYVTRVVRLAFLSPELVDAILAGEQPARLDAVKLLAMQIPCDWDEQARVLAAA